MEHRCLLIECNDTIGVAHLGKCQVFYTTETACNRRLLDAFLNQETPTNQTDAAVSSELRTLLPPLAEALLGGALAPAVDLGT